MAKLFLNGIDPGIHDTALTTIELDFTARRIQPTTVVWENVTTIEKRVITVQENFLAELYDKIQQQKSQGLSLVGIEGYRQRGLDPKQDQMMIDLIQVINRHLFGSEIVDNTGIKNVVTQPLLKLFHCHRFSKTNHSDSKSAARVALRLGISIPVINELLSEYVDDHLYKEKPWELGSMLTAQ